MPEVFKCSILMTGHINSNLFLFKLILVAFGIFQRSVTRISHFTKDVDKNVSVCSCPSFVSGVNKHMVDIHCNMNRTMSQTRYHYFKINQDREDFPNVYAGFCLRFQNPCIWSFAFLFLICDSDLLITLTNYAVMFPVKYFILVVWSSFITAPSLDEHLCRSLTFKWFNSLSHRWKFTDDLLIFFTLRKPSTTLERELLVGLGTLHLNLMIKTKLLQALREPWEIISCIYYSWLVL